jgi:hypothetical protein
MQVAIYKQMAPFYHVHISFVMIAVNSPKKVVHGQQAATFKIA